MMADTHHARDAGSARRGFIGRVIAGAAGLVAVSSSPRLLGAATVAGSGNSRSVRPGDDWIKALTAPHRTVFDVTAHRNGKPLAQAKNFLDAWRDAFQTPEHEVNLVIGVHGEAAPLVLNDAVWERYTIGQQYEVTDGGTKSAGRRNVFTSAHAAAAGLVTAEQSIEALQRRGVRFIICMNTIANTTKKLAAAGLGSADEIHAAILGGLLPEVITVPAINVALTQLQEHGVRYEKLD
jgi:intracellular sulfur oxidation DsrE/DsrF family protein